MKHEVKNIVTNREVFEVTKVMSGHGCAIELILRVTGLSI